MRGRDEIDLTDLEDNLHWIVEDCSGVDSYMNYFGHSREDFVESMMFQDCCCSKINQIIQCVNRIEEHYPAIYRQHFTDVMKGVKKMRVFFIHQYERTKPELVWNFMVNELPMIESTAIELLNGIDHRVTASKSVRGLFRRRRAF